MLPRVETQETEVSSKARRRRFTAEYKRNLLREIEECTRTGEKTGEIGAILRREGLYSSHLTSWRQEAERRELAALAPQKRGPKPKTDERDRKITEMEREISRLTKRAERAELICEIQKKVSSILGVELPPPPPDSDGKR
jgi:transposase-like protein